MKMMMFTSMLRQLTLVYKRYHFVISTVISFPILIGILSLLHGSYHPGFFLSPILFFLFLSYGVLTTNQFAVMPDDLLSHMIFPIKWISLIIARNSIILSLITLSVILIFTSTHFFFMVDSKLLLFPFFHSIVVIPNVLGVGNILSAKFPKPFPQNTFSWKGFVVVLVAMFVYGVLGLSRFYGGFWYALIIITMFILSAAFYQLSVSRSAEILQKDLHDILRLVNE